MLDYERTLLTAIPALPLLATLVTAALGKQVLRRQSHWPAVVAIAGSCVLSMLLVLEVGRKAPSAANARAAAGQETAEAAVGYERTVTLWVWANVKNALVHTPRTATGAGEASPPVRRDFYVGVTLRSDPLTAIMLSTVTLISLWVAVYSIGFMHGDPGYWRFFTYISLFVFSMTMLVSASNFALLYVFWEAVGLCSYLLIGFWYQKPAAAAAGKKAFLVNRVGDLGLAVAVFLLWTAYGTLNFHDTDVPGILGQTGLAHAGLSEADWRSTAICLLLLLGACGKSAQFPLHVWLPDATEGPAPVGPLISAATTATAGVYLVARCMPLLMASDHALQAVAIVGGLTALLATLIALTQTDLKRILAYLTISQLGYMFLGLATAFGTTKLWGVTAGMFHLVSHACFMALLFLGAGSVMHAMGGVSDVRRFGGLKRRMPVTHWTFLIGCLALAGIPPFCGFFSRNLILATVAEHRDQMLYFVLYWAALFTVFLTAVSTFRAYFLTFHGPERIPPEAGDHTQEAPRSMTGPLVILAFFVLVVGVLLGLTRGFAGFLKLTPAHSVGHVSCPTDGMAGGAEESVSQAELAVLSTLIALAGVVSAAILYLGKSTVLEKLTAGISALGLYRLAREKFFFDEAYHLLLVRPLQAIARLSYWADRTVLDGLVDLCGRVPKSIGAALRPLQNGMVQFYALAMVLGLLVLIAVLLI